MRTETHAGQIWKIVESVGSKRGTFLNSKQVSAAIKNEVFEPASAIMLHLSEGKPYRLNMVYKCTECEKVHLLALPENATEDEKLFLKEHIVYIDRTGPEEFVSIEDLTFLLDSFKDAQDICLEAMYTSEKEVEDMTYYCNRVLKCPMEQCYKAHLDCHYED